MEPNLILSLLLAMIFIAIPFIWFNPSALAYVIHRLARQYAYLIACQAAGQVLDKESPADVLSRVQAPRLQGVK